MSEVERYKIVKSKGHQPNQIALKTRVAQEGEVFIATQLLGEDAQLEALLKEKPRRIKKQKPRELSELPADQQKRIDKLAAEQVAKEKVDKAAKDKADKEAKDKADKEAKDKGEGGEGLLGKIINKATGGGN